MRIIDRYIARHMLRIFGLSVATLSFVILIHRTMLLVDLLVTKGAGVGEVLRLFLHSVPLALVISIPFSALLAGIAVYGRMTVDNESVALKTAGVSPLRLQLPALAFGIPACLLTLYISLELLPYSARAFRDLVFQMTREKVLASLQEGTFNNEFTGLSLYFKRLAPDGGLTAIMLEDRRNPPERRLVLAQEGRVTFDTEELRMNLRLRDGTIHIARPDLPGRYQLLSFETYDLRFDVGGQLGAVAARGRDRKELTLAELVREARQHRARGAGDGRWWVELHRRLAIPVSCLLFPLIGSALGLRIRRAGRMTSIVLGLAIGLGYYGLLAGGEDLGTRGSLAPIWAMWIPNAVLAVIGAWLLLLGAREGQGAPLARRWRWKAGELGRHAAGTPGT
jgi:lipopolysaccharide export system permease protein